MTIQQKLKSLEGHPQYFEMAENEMIKQLIADFQMLKQQDRASFDYPRYESFVRRFCPKCGWIGKNKKLKTKLLQYPIAGGRIIVSCGKCDYEEIYA